MFTPKQLRDDATRLAADFDERHLAIRKNRRLDQDELDALGDEIALHFRVVRALNELATRVEWENEKLGCYRGVTPEGL